MCVLSYCLSSICDCMGNMSGETVQNKQRNVVKHSALWSSLLFLLLKLKKKHKIMSHLEAITLTTIYVLTTFVFCTAKVKAVKFIAFACFTAGTWTEINSINGDIKCLSTALVMARRVCSCSTAHFTNLKQKCLHQIGTWINANAKVWCCHFIGIVHNIDWAVAICKNTHTHMSHLLFSV